jgi:hypothetical protein
MTPRAAVTLGAACALACAWSSAAPVAAAPAGPRLVLPAERAAAPDAPPADVSHLHDALDRVLRADVRDGAVDWEALRSRDRAALEIYLDAMSRVDAGALSAAERTAYWLNVHNATFLVVACGQARAWSPAAAEFAAFREPFVRLREGRVSLDSLARGIVRPRARDPRVLAALWSGARSGPRLRDRAWRGDDLDRALDAQMRAFLADPARNRFDRARRTATLSRLFDWYAADFGGPEGVRAAIARWTGRDLAGWTIAFADYDWRLAANDPR